MAAASTGIGASHFDFAEPRGAGAVARAHHLFGLAFAAVRNTPESPVLRSGNRLAGIPELGRDAAITGVFQHADAAAVTDLPADLAAELEVVALVIDRPAPVGLHVNAVAVKN